LFKIADQYCNITKAAMKKIKIKWSWSWSWSWSWFKFTPFKSFLPLAGKMLTYLEAMRNPKKHMVKTLAMGRTAILMVPRRVCPPPT
jgi:hypothetical protein